MGHVAGRVSLIIQPLKEKKFECSKHVHMKGRTNWAGHRCAGKGPGRHHRQSTGPGPFQWLVVRQIAHFAGNSSEL